MQLYTTAFSEFYSELNPGVLFRWQHFQILFYFSHHIFLDGVVVSLPVIIQELVGKNAQRWKAQSDILARLFDPGVEVRVKAIYMYSHSTTKNKQDKQSTIVFKDFISFYFLTKPQSFSTYLFFFQFPNKN